MNDFEDFGLNEQGRQKQMPGDPHPHAVGSPLPMGSAASSRSLAQEAATQTPSVPLGRALTGPTAGAPSDQPSSLQRAVNAIRMALPFVQRILPLLDGNIATAVSNILAPHPHPHQQPQAQQPPVDLVHVEDGLAELQNQHVQLREQISEQNTSLKRVEDQLEMVREATDRNTLEQQELMEDLKVFGNRVVAYAVIASVLLLASIFFNLILFIHLQRVLP
jgi:hypothetical protein